MTLILTPDHPDFDRVSSRLLPAFWRNQLDRHGGAVVWCARSETGLLEPLSYAETDEYLYGGEYDERLAQSGQEGTA